MTRALLPGARAAIVGAGGLAERSFYSWMQAINRAVNDGGDVDQATKDAIAGIAKALGSPDGSVDKIPKQGLDGVINGNGSILVDGTLESGAVNLSLAYDTLFPGATAYYGSGPSGDRGWFPVSSSLASTPTIQLEVDDGTGVSSFNLVGFGALTSDDLAEGGAHLYFTKQRVAASLVQGAGIVLSADVAGNTTISLSVDDGGVLLTDWAGEQLSDWAGEFLEDWTPAATDVTTVFGRTGNVMAVAGDYTTDQVTEGANLYFAQLRVRNTVLLGLATGSNTTIAAADSLLIALAKLQAQVSSRHVVGSPVKFPSYTLATLPPASSNQDTMVICTDTSTGRRPVWSDGTNWLRLDTNTVAS